MGVKWRKPVPTYAIDVNFSGIGGLGVGENTALYGKISCRISNSVYCPSLSSAVHFGKVMAESCLFLLVILKT